MKNLWIILFLVIVQPLMCAYLAHAAHAHLRAVEAEIAAAADAGWQSCQCDWQTGAPECPYGYTPNTELYAEACSTYELACAEAVGYYQQCLSWGYSPTHCFNEIRPQLAQANAALNQALLDPDMCVPAD